MAKLARIAVVLSLVSTGLLFGAGAAQATTPCNDNDKDVWVGDESLVFVGLNLDPNDSRKGVCVRVLGQGTDVLLPPPEG